jgi:hypothetical protein
MTKHTPGPWEVRVHRGRTLKVESHIAVHGPGNNTIAVMVIGGFFTEKDARLIAAAPDLLEACEQAECWLTAERDNPGQASPKELLRVLATAIAKARP